MGLYGAMEMSIGTYHTADAEIFRPRGDCTYLTMCFQTPFFIMTEEGMEEGRPGDCIIHSPGFTHHHGSVKGGETGFRNDWIHVKPAGMEELVRRYALPLNRLIAGSDGTVLRPHISRIRREYLSRGAYWGEEVSLQIEQMYLTLGRLAMARNEKGPAAAKKNESRLRLIEVRAALYSDICHKWTVGEMAESACLSENRFAVLYKEAFGISPIEDLTESRMNEARRLLTGTKYNVEQVALHCGFSSLYYFSALFKKRNGVSPRDYRRDPMG